MSFYYHFGRNDYRNNYDKVMRVGNICRNELGDRKISVSLVVQENVLWEIWVKAVSPAENHGMKRGPGCSPPTTAETPRNTTGPQ